MAGVIPKETVEQIRHAADIVQVIGSYIPLKKAGATWKALCPFHKEKTPSFLVNPARQAFKCFGCGAGGDVFKFISLYENIDFPAAVHRLGEKLGIRIEEEAGSPEAARSRSQRERLLELHAAVAVWWKQLLLRDPVAEPARAYLRSRRIGRELAEEFGLGFAPDSWDGTMNWAMAKGFDIEWLDLAGLVSTNESGRRYDRFRGRLMFPICDDVGRVVAFSGRLLDPEAKAAKYVNSPETPLFSKGRILFGLDKTKRAILEARRAVVCEGQIDLMRCWEAGIRNAVAPQGTAFTEHQGRLLKRYAEEVVLCFDADTAGRHAAERSIDMLLACDLQIRIAAMPAGEDPDSLLLKGRKDEFEQLLAQAPDYPDYLLEASCREHDTASPRGRAAVANRMAAVVIRIPDPTRRHFVANQVAARLQIPLAVFEEEVRKAKSPPRPQGASDPAPAAAAPSPAEPIRVDAVVDALLDLLLARPELAPVAQRQLHPEWIEDAAGGDLLRKLLDAHAHDAWHDAPAFLADCDDAEREYLAGLLVKPRPIPPELQPDAYAVSLVIELQEKWRRRRIQVLEQEIKSNRLGPEELALKSKQLLDMVRARA